MLNRDCPICDAPGDACHPLKGIADDPWSLVRCGSCGFVFLRNPPDYETLSTAYSWDTTYEQEKEARRLTQGGAERTVRAGMVAVKRGWKKVMRRNKVKALAHRHVTSGGPWVELGSDTGYNVDNLPEGATPVGIELSGVLAERSRDRFEAKGGRVIHAPALQGLGGLPSSSCSGALAISYLEHEIRPRDVLDELHRVLQASAPVVIKVPNHGSWLRLVRGRRWSGYRFPDHVNYFAPSSLARLLLRCGFSVARFGAADRLPTSDNMWCVARKTA